MDTTIGLSSVTQKILLFCGILAPLLTLGTDWLAGKLLKGYSFSAESMSVLSAAGSPTRTLVVPLTIVACSLLISFGIGTWRGTSQEVLPRIVSILLIGNAAATLLATTFFPNQYGVRPIFGSVGVLIMFCGVLFSVLAFVFGAMAFSGWLRVVSIAIPVAFALLAVLRFATATPASGGVTLIGIQERTMAYAFQLWVMALAIYLLLSSKGTSYPG